MLRTSLVLAVAALSITALAAVPQPDLKSIKAAIGNEPTAAHPTRVLVRFRPGTTRADADVIKSRARVQGSLKTFAAVAGLELLEAGAGRRDAVLAALRADPRVLYAEPDYEVRALATPNDPSFSQLWGLNNTGQTVNGDPGTAGAHIRATSAWNLWTGDQSFRIAVIDTGINDGHPDLAPNMWTNPGETPGDGIDNDGNDYVDDVHGFNFITDTGNAVDDNGHGSHTAGTIGARGNNGIGVTGVNWQCRLVALKFLDAGGSGFTSDAVEAVQYVIDNDIKVSNNSWGGGGFSQALYDTIEAAQSVGHIFVAAAGNSLCGLNNDSSPHYPSSYDLANIISVAATDNDDRITGFSMYGLSSVDLGAPGDDVYSAWLGSSYKYARGTSMATPHVTGVVALVQSKNPSWTWQTVRNRVLSTVRPVESLKGRTVTGGVVDAVAALGDCNANGIQDSSELAGHDCNGNGRLDACEPDCNANSVADACEIAAGAPDCNANGRPDSCEIGWNKDCNTNGSPDLCDIHAGLSSDCNENGVPDSCDIAAGTSSNCNGNGIPDDCERDCNGNGIADGCDLSAGTATDANGDGLLDECALGFAVHPISATGSNVIEGRQIFLSPGSQRVTLEIRLSGWDADLDGMERVSIFQATVDTESFKSGQQGTLDFADVPCTSDANCVHDAATQSTCFAGKCDFFSSLFPFEQRPDFILRDFRTLSLSNQEFYWVGGLSCDFQQGAADQGDDRYVGTLVLDVPANAQGTFVVGVAPDDLYTFLYSPYIDLITPGPPVSAPGHHPALITLPADCNQNGIDDACETACGPPDGHCDIPGCGTAADCNGNRTPDVCIWLEKDCNGNSTPDPCDIDEGESEDCNANGIPDECDSGALDCNGNTVPDECDVASGFSQDCTGNGVPDECEPDCNGNTQADSCDIDDATSSDCNDNHVPDECDLAQGVLDCNANNVPDECDLTSGLSPDCNGNDIPDECDLDGGASADCDANHVPDECVGPDADCNDNHVPDACDIDGGGSEDCNENGLPDECEDCNANGVADACDLDQGTSVDNNGNGVPDECDHILYVDHSATGANNGLTWADAYIDLQNAFDFAANPANPVTQVWIAEGVYHPDRGTGDRLPSFRMTRDIALFGGFGGNDRQFGQRDPLAHPTVLSGDLNGDDASGGLDEEAFYECRRGPGIPFEPGCEEFDFDSDGDVDDHDARLGWHIADNSFHVVHVETTVADGRLDGLIVKGGSAEESPDPNDRDGGGIAVYGRVSIVNCVVTENWAAVGGGIGCRMWIPDVTLIDSLVARNRSTFFSGGLSCTGGRAHLVRSTFEDNRSNRNGGVSVSDVSVIDSCVFRRNHCYAEGGGLYVVAYTLMPTITKCLFEENTSDQYGGGVYVWRGSPTFANCLFRNNVAGYGGGAAARDGSVKFVNCVFTKNSASNGGGLVKESVGYPAVINCTFYKNDSGNGALYYYNYSPTEGRITVTNSILYGNTGAGSIEMRQIRISNGFADVDYNCIQGWTGNLGGTGNLGSDPLYANPDGPDAIPGTDDDDLTLLSGSPCVDAADNDALPADAADLDADGNTVERLPKDAAGNNRVLDDPSVADTGQGTYPIVDMGAFEAGLDCNGNDVADVIDIANGTSVDCTGNGVPDECEPDCDDSGQADSCDIAAGLHQDCNDNDEPDACDLVLGQSLDCDENGVPDECQTDSDGDGVINLCDGCPMDPAKVHPGICGCGVSDADSDGDTVADCHDECPGHDDLMDSDGDGVPNRCDQCPGFDDALDDDADAVPDGCDRCPGFNDQQDGDGDGAPDACDLCPGHDDEVDCNDNGAPDGCDIVAGDSADANFNGVPDECDPPSVVGEGGRYLRIQLPPGDFPVALRVQSPQFGCLNRFADFDADPALALRGVARLTDFAVYRTPLQWGALHVRGPQIVPGASYQVSALTDVQAVLINSSPAVAATWPWGEVDGLPGVNVLDIALLVDRAKFEDLSAVPVEAADLAPCEPDATVNVLDISLVVDAVKELAFPCAPPCP